MNVFNEFGDRVAEVISALAADGELPSGLDVSRIVVEPPREAGHGDLATNAAMVLAKPAGRTPRDLAELIASRLRGLDDVAAVEVAGPGFINLGLKPEFWHELLRHTVGRGEAFAEVDIGHGERINVEYVSANPTGPLHVGHCRGAVFGDALANLLARAGYEVTREYYINDAGAQVEVLARSAHLRYREALGEDIGEIPEGLYPGEYLKPVGRMLAESEGERLLGVPESVWLPIVRDRAVGMMMDMIRDDLATLDIRHDVFFSESSLVAGNEDRIAAAIDVLRGLGVIYEGRLPPPKGQLPEDWEDREQTLFRSTGFGDDVDRPLRKSDGSHTYFAADIAYHLTKLERGFRSIIDVWGADHGGYVKRMQAAVAALSDGKAELDVKLCQLVRLFRGGEPVKMSKRAGDFITLREVVDEVGPDAVRFMMIYRKNDAPLDFDFVRVTEQSRDNPVFYVQYAHARCHSVLRNAAEAFPDADLSGDALAKADYSQLQDEAEIGLIRRIAEYPRLLEAAALAHEPHRLAFYLHDLASDFHALWNRGKDLPQLRFINPADPASSFARLGLIRGLTGILAGGLSVLGVAALEEMR